MIRSLIHPLIKYGAISIAALGILVILAATFLWFKPLPSFPHDAQRDLPWQLPDYKAANTHMEILDDGRIKIEIEHLPLVNIEPQMVAYFYQVLPISTVQLNGQLYPLYHLFHPSEHGKIEVKQAASDGTPGMAVGALVGRQEWFGKFNSKGAGRVISINAHGMTVKPEMMGLHFGQIEHIFEKTEYGTRYRVKSIIGSDLPIIGGAINYYIRHKMFNPEMLKQWLRHQVEEVSSLPFFLAELYGQKDSVQDHHYVLNITSN